MFESDFNERWSVDGKFFRCGAVRVEIRAVTYGPFPGGWPENFDRDFQRISSAGFNSLRLYEMPERRLLDAAMRRGLWVFGGLNWGQNADFFQSPALLSAARVQLVNALEEVAKHPALAGVYVGNEIPADLVRWMGPLRVRHAIEGLIALGRELAPELLFAYANYPSTEYLEPENADFTALNVYLENAGDFRSYLKRLHHIAGDRPLVISEFGLDSSRNGLARQAATLEWALLTSRQEECAGFTLYAWSDRWWNQGAEVLDWDFGLIDRSGADKPALAAIQAAMAQVRAPQCATHDYSVIVCTRNGRGRIGGCLEAVARMKGADFETIVVDDGSEDGTAEWVAARFPWAKCVPLGASGLSAARNAGAAAASGEILAFTDDDCMPDHEWLLRLDRVFTCGHFASVGGPNLPPPPKSWSEAVVCASPGAPSHVMLDDVEAEHLPGCNLAVRKSAFEAVGGFDPQFHTAGDDVDFCWRLSDAGYRLGFAPGAFVWHWRRASLLAFLRQQIGYGVAEKLLISEHPQRFTTRGTAKWRGFVYGGGPVRVAADSVIYFGAMGRAGYQSLVTRMLPLRGLDLRFHDWRARLALRVMTFIVPRLRGWARCRSLRIERWPGRSDDLSAVECHEWEVSCGSREETLERLLRDAWQPGGETDGWDLEKGRTRLLIANTHAVNGEKTTLVRVWGDPSALPHWLLPNAKRHHFLDPSHE